LEGFFVIALAVFSELEPRRRMKIGASESAL